MKITSWDEGIQHLREHLTATRTVEDMPRRVAALPGETFADPTGWRYALIYEKAITIVRVGPRGGIEPLYSLTRHQLAYLGGLL